MNAAARPRSPAAAFPLAALAVLGLCAAAARVALTGRGAAVLPWAVLFDLLVTLPLGYLWLVVRGRGASPRGVFAVLAAGAVAARLLLGHAPAVRPALLVVGALLEAGVMVRLALAVRAGARARADDAVDRIRAAAVDLAGPRAGGILADELCVLGLGLFGAFARAREGAERFSHHRESGRTALVIGLGGLVLVETFAVHFALVRPHPGIAWTLTVSSLYAVLWLVADLHAQRVRRTRIENDVLRVRVGLLFELDLPLGDVTTLRTRFESAGPATLRAVPRGVDPTVAIELAVPAELRFPYGFRRRGSVVLLAPDDRARFVALLAAHGVPVDPPVADQ